MASAAEVVRPDFGQSTMVITATGKLVEQRQDNGVYYTGLLMPAPDEFSQPMPLEIRSRRPLGGRNDIVTVSCRVSGYYRRTYDATNKNTGEIRRVRPVALALDLIEN